MAWQQPVIVSLLSLLVGSTATQVFVKNTPDIAAVKTVTTVNAKAIEKNEKKIDQDMNRIQDSLNAILVRLNIPLVVEKPKQ
jgi:hypothetical protein